MGDRKSANRLPFGRDEGIWRALRGDRYLPHHVEYIVCGRVISTSRLALSSHGKKHVRDGDATASVEYTDDGPRTVFALPLHNPHDLSAADGAVDDSRVSL